MQKVAIVTGGSSGIGLATARLLVKKDWKVYELSRNGQGEQGISHVTADVSLEESVAAAFERIYAETGRLDLLINSAGFGISGAIELTELSDVKRLFDVNFFGALTCIKCAVPYLRKTGGGHIINLSSVAAPVAIPFQAFYSCTKAAVNDLTLALANELRPFNIRVCAVMPGDVRTGFTSARKKNEAGQELYGDAIQKAVNAMERDEQRGMSPKFIATAIVRAAEAPHPKPLYTPGLKYKLFVLIAKLLPARLVNWMVWKVYS